MHQNSSSLYIIFFYWQDTLQSMQCIVKLYKNYNLFHSVFKQQDSS